MKEAKLLLDLGYIQSANRSRWLISRMHSLVQMVCWNQNKASKSEPKLNILRRNRNKVGYLQGRCYILVVLTHCNLFGLEASLPFSYSSLGVFFTSFMPLGSIYWWNAIRRAFCVIALSVRQSDPLFSTCLLSHPHILIRMQCLISCCLACELCVCFYVFCQCLLITGWSFFTSWVTQSSLLPLVLPWQKMRSTSLHSNI